MKDFLEMVLALSACSSMIWGLVAILSLKEAFGKRGALYASISGLLVTGSSSVLYGQTGKPAYAANMILALLGTFLMTLLAVRLASRK
jgi:hypothetical protein